MNAHIAQNIATAHGVKSTAYREALDVLRSSLAEASAAAEAGKRDLTVMVVAKGSGMLHPPSFTSICH